MTARPSTPWPISLAGLARLGLCLALVTGLAPAAAAQAPEAVRPLHLTASPGAPPVLEARINGAPVRLLVAPDAPRFVLLNPAAADRLGLRANPLLSLGVRVDIGGDVSRGRTGRARVAPAGYEAFRQRVVWFEDFDVARGADGVIGLTAILSVDRLVVTIADPERPADAAMAVARFPGRAGFEWVAYAEEDGLPLALRFSFSKPSSLARSTSAAFSMRGLIAPATEDLTLAPFWFIDEALAFEFPNRTLSLGGVAPDRFLRFAERSELEAHRRRVEYERRYGPIDAITVRAPGARDPDDPYQLTLGGDALTACWRIEFDYRSGAVTLRCPVRAPAR